MTARECRHQWLDTHDREGDAFRCMNCGEGRRCECSLHFNAWSSVHSKGCPLRIEQVAW